MTETKPRVETLPSDPWWESTALSAIEHLAANGQQFTAADLTDLGVPEPDHPARWGSVIAKAKALKIIEKAGYTTARRPSRNAGVTAVWRAAA